MAEARVRRVAESDWRALRDVRLRALADAPDAFGSTLEREAAFDDGTWADWAREAAVGATESCFLAWAEDEAVGVVGAFVEAEHDRVHLIAMWVAPHARRLGLGRALVDAVAAWAGEIGARAIRLDVSDDNGGARRLYDASGFSPTGRTRQYEDRPHLTTIELERQA